MKLITSDMAITGYNQYRVFLQRVLITKVLVNAHIMVIFVPKNIVTLYPNGDVGFCGRMTNENKDYIYGSILNQDMISLYDSEGSKK